MLSFTGSLKVFVAVEPCDLRRGHNGLLSLVGEKLQEDVKSGALVAFGCLRFAPAVFTNKRRRLLKILYWDGTGLWLTSKRLEPARSKDRLPAGSPKGERRESTGHVFLAAQCGERHPQTQARAGGPGHAHRRR